MNSMNIWETIGFAYVVLTSSLATVGLFILALRGYTKSGLKGTNIFDPIEYEKMIIREEVNARIQHGSTTGERLPSEEFEKFAEDMKKASGKMFFGEVNKEWFRQQYTKDAEHLKEKMKQFDPPNPWPAPPTDPRKDATPLITTPADRTERK